jgi:hypothetical protein
MPEFMTPGCTLQQHSVQRQLVLELAALPRSYGCRAGKSDLTGKASRPAEDAGGGFFSDVPSSHGEKDEGARAVF